MKCVSPEIYGACRECISFNNAAKHVQEKTGAPVVYGSCTEGTVPGSAQMRFVIADGEGGVDIQEVGEVSCPGVQLEWMNPPAGIINPVDLDGLGQCSVRGNQ